MGSVVPKHIHIQDIFLIYLYFASLSSQIQAQIQMQMQMILPLNLTFYSYALLESTITITNKKTRCLAVLGTVAWSQHRMDQFYYFFFVYDDLLDPL